MITKMSRFGRLAALTGVVVAAMAAVTATTAIAATEVKQGSDWGTYYAGSDRIWIHDKECDGNTAYLWYHFKGISDGKKRLEDASGCSGGGSKIDLTGDFPRGATGVWIQVCEDQSLSGDPCSGWVSFTK